MEVKRSSLTTNLPLYLIFTTFFFLQLSLAADNSTYNVQSFGANPDGLSDCTKAFLSAWAAACACTSSATVYVPPGNFSLGQLTFSGELCNNKDISIRIDGNILARSNYNVVGDSGNWVVFHRVVGISISGGIFDGQGSELWACKRSGQKCPHGATALAFYNSDNITINGLSSLNSQMFHVIFHGCQNTKIDGVKISAPEDSPNTDGIHVEFSSNVTITNSNISTGDDCISIGPGSSNLWIENVTCGPGHGISIGSLGWVMEEAGVQNVTVKTARFTGTENGVRIKTWARPSNGFVKHVLFQHIDMVNVENPIIIDQNYCPGHKSCPGQESGINISDITYEGINGTSATQVGVKLVCSKSEPCSEIILEDVSLTYKDQPAQSVVENAKLVKPNNTCCL